MIKLAIKKYKIYIVFLFFLISTLILTFNILFNNMLLTDSHIKNYISKKVNSDIKIISNENNQNYKIVFFEANGKLGISTYKLNQIIKWIGNDYIFSYEYSNTSNLMFVKGNDSYNYIILNYGYNQKEFIIYGKNLNNSLNSIIISVSGVEKIIDISNKDNFIINRIVSNNNPTYITLVTKVKKIKIY